MRFTLRKGAVTALAGAATVLSLALGGTAVADPNLNNAGASLPGFLPDSNDVVGVGSDTTQYVVNTAAQVQAASNPSVRVASFNAFKPGTESSPVTSDSIVIRDPDGVANSGDEVTLARPNGSSAGITALINNPQLTFARSSRFRGSAVAEQNLYFIPALVDGLSYIVDKSAASDIRNLDNAELAAIYRCTDTRGYHPKLPQTGSGTRSFFLAQIGVADNEVGSCVQQNVQEHDATPVVGDAVALAPFSTARFVNNPPSPANPPSNIVDIAANAPTAGVFYTTRTVYNVVRKADYDAPGSPLPAIFGPDAAGTAGGFFCDRYARFGSARQGFAATTDCGSLL